MKKLILLLMLASVHSVSAMAQLKPNYDESKVGQYILPDLLKSADGKSVKSVKEWERTQRPYLLRLYEQQVYGRIPAAPKQMHWELNSEVKEAVNGKATCKQWTIWFNEGSIGRYMQVITFLPNKVKGPVPVFIGLNFLGNQSIVPDKYIQFNAQWQSKDKKQTFDDLRGNQERRYPLEAIIDNGFAIASCWYGDVEPDQPEGWREGVRGTMQEALAIRPDEWGALAAWGWGMSRMADLLEKEPRIDPKKLIAYGHSRLGKAAVWAGARDQRFAMVISNNSGEGGAALSRRTFGETIADLNKNFPHWFIPAYKNYSGHADKLPVDQHMLLALVAPRLLYVASASEDLWADPRGEYESAWQAQPVYSLYGKKGLPGSILPQPSVSVGESIGYHLRVGRHDMLTEDWNWYLQFARKRL